MRKILLRFDDICPTMDWVQWGIAEDEMKKRGIKPVIGVIPDCKDPDLRINEPRADFWEYIKNLQHDGYCVAMHGYQHVFDIKNKALITNRKDSEFAGHTYEEQYNKISQGIQILRKNGIDTDVFFAPAHSYDKITLKALYNCGFRFVVDGKSYKIIVRNGLKCVPCRDAGVPHIHRTGIYVAIFHAHEWARADKRGEYEKFMKLCQNKDICSFDDIRDVKPGNYVFGVADEKVFMWYDYNLRPILSWLKRSFLDNRTSV